MMREVAVWILVFVLALALQGSVVPAVAIAGITPDVPLIALFFFAVRMGCLPGILAGFLLGLCQDLYSPSLLGQNAFACTLCGWFAGMFNDRVMRTDPLLKGVILAAAFFLRDILVGISSTAAGEGSLTATAGDLLFRTLPRSVYSLALVSCFFIWAMYFKPSRRK